MKNDEVVVELKHVSKVYTLHHEKPTLVETLFGNRDRVNFTALNDISLKIFRGEKVGIIGHNGSGKTTLLKIISRIATPTMGQVTTKGKVVSLIDLTAGFHPDLSGYENIFLNGLIIGMSNQQIYEKLDQIIEFADIGEFMYSPVFTYSEGMKLRLGFSVAVHSDPDILILDEGISAGDIDFQQKSGDKIEQLFKEDKTIIVVSHWLEYLKEHCDKFFLFEHGQIVSLGGSSVVKAYQAN